MSSQEQPTESAYCACDIDIKNHIKALPQETRFSGFYKVN